MPIKHINHAIKEGNRHGPFFVPLLIIVFIFSVAFFCASINYFIRLFCMNRRRSRSDIARQRYLPVGLRDKKSKKRKNNSDDSSNSSTDDDDDWEEQYHVWDPEEARLVKQQRNAEEKETNLNKKVRRIKKQLNQYETQLNTAREQKIQLTSRLNTSREHREMQTSREIEILSSADQKGRKMYGEDAWDNGIDGGPPLKMLLSLEKDEIEYVKQGVLTARREEAANNNNKKVKDGRNNNKNNSNRFDQQQQQQYQNDTMYGINDIELNIKYENEIGDKYVGHHDTITNARNLTERLKRHNDNTQRKDANRTKKTKKTKKKKKEKKSKRSKDV